MKRINRIIFSAIPPCKLAEFRMPTDFFAELARLEPAPRPQAT